MTRRTYRALLVANSTFPDDVHNLPDLEGPRNDPVLLRDALCDREVGLFPTDNVRLVTDRTMAEVLREVEDFLRTATNQDTLLLYYSGHGMLDLSNELFFCTRDTRTERLRSTAVKASDLRAMMDESVAAALVVILDCCHSGRFKGGDVAGALSGRGRFVLTSSRPAELARDAHTRNHASLFTHHLAEGLRHGAEDLHGDGLVTLSELYDYVHSALAGEGRPEPQKRFAGSGDVAMAVRPLRHERRAVQPELIDPALAAPMLDLPETAIDLGEIEADEILPPERIAVINRGGGSLEWTVESSAPWLRTEAEEGAAILHLRPKPGSNRANVYVKDTRSGVIKTVRVTVRVKAGPSEPEPEVQPMPRPVTVPGVGMQDEPPAVSEVTTPTEPAEPARRRTPSIAAGVILAGVALAFPLVSQPADSEFARTEASGIGIGLSVLTGLVLVVLGIVAQLRRGRPRLLACCLGVLVPVAFVRVGEMLAYSDGQPLAMASVAICAVVAARIVRHLRESGLWHRSNWPPPPLVGWTMTTAVLWAASLFAPHYHQDAHGGSNYGGLVDDQSGAGPGLLVAGLAVVVCIYWGLRRLSPPAGPGLVAGAAVVPLVGVVHELDYLLYSDDQPDDARLLITMIVPALALVTTGVASVVATPSPTTARLRWPAVLGGTLRGTARTVWRHPLRALVVAAVASGLSAGIFLVLPDGYTGEQLATLEVSSTLSANAFSADGRYLATSGYPGARLWDTRMIDSATRVGNEPTTHAAFSPDGRFLATTGSSGLDPWDASSGAPLTSLSNRDVDVRSLVFSPDGSRLITIVAAAQPLVELWDTQTGQTVDSIEVPDAESTSVAFSPDSETLAISTVRQDPETFNVEARVELVSLSDTSVRTLTVDDHGRPDALAFSPDGAVLAVADGNVELWEPATNRRVDLLDVGASWRRSLLPDTGLLVVAVDEKVEVWNTSSEDRVASLSGHDDHVTAVAVSPDGRLIASSSGDGSIRLWRTPD